MNGYLFVLIIVGMGIVGLWGIIVFSQLRSRFQSKKENADLKKTLEAMQNEMAALRERFDDQYANVTLALDELRSEKSVRREIAEDQDERESLALEQTRTDDDKE